MLKRNELAFIAFLMVVLSSGILMIYANEQPEPIITDIQIMDGNQFISRLDKMDLEKASSLGFKGYIKLSCENYPEEVFVEKGSYVDIPITVELVTFDSKLSTTNMFVDPKNEEGWRIEQSLGKDMPRIVLNDLVDFNIKGDVELVKGQKFVLVARVTIPEDSPSYSIPFGAIGISSEMSTVDTIKVMIHVQ